MLGIATLATYVGGLGRRQSYFAHWILPGNEPLWDSVQVFQAGIAAVGVVLVFVIWVASAAEGKPPVNASKTRRKVYEMALAVPILLYASAALGLLYFAGIITWHVFQAGLRAHAGGLANALVILIGVGMCATGCWWFAVSAKREETGLGDSRGMATAMVAFLVLVLLGVCFGYGRYFGDAEGQVDAAGDKSTLLHVSFTYANGTQDPTDWRLLAHAGASYYVFTFEKPSDKPPITMIPDSAVLRATLRAP